MNATELRAAAIELRDGTVAAASGHDCDTPADVRLLVSQMTDLAAHILATVREDDDETYFSSWGREMLGATTLQLNKHFGLCTDSCDIEYEDDDSFDSIETTVRTRGEFRALCRCLGVTLRETTASNGNDNHSD